MDDFFVEDGRCYTLKRKANLGLGIGTLAAPKIYSIFLEDSVFKCYLSDFSGQFYLKATPSMTGPSWFASDFPAGTLRLATEAEIAAWELRYE